MNEGFPPERRIRKGGEFAAVLKRGRRRSCPYFSLHISARRFVGTALSFPWEWTL